MLIDVGVVLARSAGMTLDKPRGADLHEVVSPAPGDGLAGARHATSSRWVLALGSGLSAALLSLAAPVARASEPVRIEIADPVLDRNGDGLQDIIFAGRAIHHDIDCDGKFDFTLVFAFKEYTPEGHREYLASGFAPAVYAQLTRKGLDNLCASERVAANWTAEHFREFLYYHHGYGQLRIFDDSPENDGRLAGTSPHPSYAYSIAFNPDGSVASIRRGDRTIALATFDHETNTAAGIRLTLPQISRPEDLAGIRSKLENIFADAAGPAPARDTRLPRR